MLKEGSVEISAKIIFEMFESNATPKKVALDFVIRVYKKSTDQGYKDHLKDVFWYIVDNYVDNKEPS